MDCIEDEIALICNYFGSREGFSGLSKLERSLNDIIKAMAFYSQIVMLKNANLGFLRKCNESVEELSHHYLVHVQ